MKIFIIGFAIASVVSAVVGMVMFLRLGEAVLRIIHYFSGQGTRQQSPAKFAQPAFCKQCRCWQNHHRGCPSLSTEAAMIFSEGWQDAAQSKPLSRPNHPAYMLARSLYGRSSGPDDGRARLAGMSMQI
jgi:hypothetical protein